MDIPKIYKPTNITKTAFTANWESGADKYYLDVASDADFSTYISGFSAKEIITNYDLVTGLSDLSHYFYRIKAEDNPDTGTATSGTLTTLTDNTKTWTPDAYIGMFVRITDGTGITQLKEITSNTIDTLTVAFDIAPDATSVYEIADISNYSYVMEVVTGFFVSGMSLEFGNLIADLFNVQGITIEVSTDFNLKITVAHINSKINSAKCTLTKSNWNYKGDWNPNSDPTPTSATDGDYYEISASGDSEITGEIETFTTVDILLYDTTWQLSRRRIVYSDVYGIANMITDYNIDNILTVSASTYETQTQILNYTAGMHEYSIQLPKQKQIIFTKNGTAINLKPQDPSNKMFS